MCRGVVRQRTNDFMAFVYVNEKVLIILVLYYLPMLNECEQTVLCPVCVRSFVDRIQCIRSEKTKSN